MTQELNEAPQRSVDLQYSYTTVTFKQQGNGTDSWVISYFNDKDEQVFAEIVYKDPAKPDTETADKTIEGLTDENIILLWEKLIEKIDLLPQVTLDKLKDKLK